MMVVHFLIDHVIQTVLPLSSDRHGHVDALVRVIPDELEVFKANFVNVL